MDGLQRTLQHAFGLWRSLGRSQQIGLGALGAMALALVFFVTTFARTPDMGVAFPSLSDEDAATVVAKLKEAKIPYQIGDRNAISVPSALVNDVKVMLAGQGIGGKPSASAGYELFNQPSFGLTDFAQKVNYQRALEGELARSIGRLDAVQSARVHLVLPQQTLFASQQKDATASVIVQLKSGKGLDRGQVHSISSLVAGSVEGLKPENIAIVDTSGTTLTGDGDAAGPSALSTKQVEAQQAYETSVARNLQTLLDRVLGPDVAAVQVSAELGWDQVEQTEEIYAPQGAPTPVVRSTHEVTENQQPGSTGAAAGGVPGTASNADGSIPTYQGAQAGQGGYEKKETQATYEISRSVQKTVRAPGAVKRLNVSVLLDQAAVDPGQAETIRQAIATAAGIDTRGRGDEITVTALPFNRAEAQKAKTAVEEAQQQDRFLAYARLGALALGPLVLVVVLAALLRRPKGQRPGPGQAAMPVPMRAAAARRGSRPAAANAPDVAASPVARVAPQPLLEDPQKSYVRNQIDTLAQTSPATVAQLIQTWLDEDRRN